MPNNDEIEHYIVLLLVSSLTGIATKYGVDGNTLTMICSGLAAAVVAGISIYRRTNMKVVAENSTAIKLPGNQPAPVGSSISIGAGGAAKVVGALLIGFLVMHAMPAVAQPKAASRIAAPAQPSTLAAYPKTLLPKPALLKLPNPLGWPDPLCITDHPSASCANSASGGGALVTGNPEQDLVTILETGGVVYVRDLMRADQYAAYPCDPTSAGYPGNCTQTKSDPLNSACLEAVIPLAKLIVLGPPTAANNGAPLVSPASAAPAAAATAGAASSAPTTTAAATLSAPLTAADEALVTMLTKMRLVRLAFTGPSLKQGCAGLVQDEVNTVMNPAALLSLITAGPLAPIVAAVGG